MTEYNAFLAEWKAIKTAQEEILDKLNRKLTKHQCWGLGGLLIGFLVIGILLGVYLNTRAQQISIPYAVSSEEGCNALGGKWAIQEGGKFCYFYAK